MVGSPFAVLNGDRLQGLLENESGGARPSPQSACHRLRRPECLHGAGIEHGAIRVHSNGERCQNLAVFGIENHHVLWVTGRR